MKLIRTGFRHGVYRRARMESILRLQDTRFDFEFLQRVRKRNRQCQVVVRIRIILSVNKNETAVPCPPSNRSADLRKMRNGVIDAIAGRISIPGKKDD